RGASRLRRLSARRGRDARAPAGHSRAVPALSVVARLRRQIAATSGRPEEPLGASPLARNGAAWWPLTTPPPPCGRGRCRCVDVAPLYGLACAPAGKASEGTSEG